MDVERWQQVNALLDAVMELPSGEQRAYLDVHCSDDPALRREVLSLMEAHGEAESFLEAPAKEYAATLIDMGNNYATDALVGKQIDEYEILGVLGRGGMGIVYKAEDEALSRLVALKMIDPGLARDEAFVRRFRAEARALARIDSRHIVRVHAMRQTEARLYIVMEYVDGGTLSDPLKDGPMPWAKAQPLVEQMLTALEHAHSVGVTHRDIKPSNIMLSSSGMVKVTDFGLAKVHQNDAAATVTQGIAGTIRYMSPEQVKGSRDLDHRSDLFSMGMTIYQLLAGRLPFDDDSSDFALMRAIVEDRFPAPTTFHPSIPKPVAEALMKALEKDPRDRFQSAAEMRAALASASGGAVFAGADAPTVTEAQAYPSNGSPKEKKLSQRTILWGGMGVIAVLLLAAGGIFMFGFSDDGEPPPDATTSPMSLTSVPEEVRVYANDVFLGVTPLDGEQVEAGDGNVRFRFQKAGYLTRDTVLSVEAGTAVPLSRIVLEEDGGDVVPVRIISQPSQAAVRINSELAGRTPLADVPLPAGEGFSVEIRQEGCQPWTRDYDRPQDISAELVCQTTDPDPEPEQRDNPPPATGTLTLNVAPSGSIEVAGENCQAGTPCTVRAGSKTVTVDHPTYGRHTLTLAVAAGQNERHTVYLEQPVVVQVRNADTGSPIWGTIFVDGEQSGMLQDLPLRLGPGTHRIEVQREQFDVLTTAQEVNIEPGFQEQAPQKIVFRIRAK